MDWVTVRNRTLELFRKYKYVCLILALGMILMSLPEGAEVTQGEQLPETADVQPGTSDRLEAILTQIDGVGKVRVMLTESAGAETIYQTDEDSSAASDSQSIRVETVIVSDSNRTETGLVRQVNPPSFRGAIVVCQGAEKAEVRLSVVEAVSNVTGISTDRITVLKMK